MRRKDETLRDTLLQCAREMVESDGIGAVNIRALAQKAGVATGTVYNYFSNKDEILLALTEGYWQLTLEEMKTAVTADSFSGQLEEIFHFLRERIEHSAGKLMSSLGNVEAAGQERMATMQSALQTALICRMEQDGNVRQDIWKENFTKEQFARFITRNMTILLKSGDADFDFFLTIVKRTIY